MRPVRWAIETPGVPDQGAEARPKRWHSVDVAIPPKSGGADRRPHAQSFEDPYLLPRDVMNGTNWFAVILREMTRSNCSGSPCSVRSRGRTPRHPLKTQCVGFTTHSPLA